MQQGRLQTYSQSMGTIDRTTTKRITFGDDRSPGADIAWGWIAAQVWPGWMLDVVTVTDPDPEIASLFTHAPLHEFAPERPRTAPESSGMTEVRHLTTAYDPRIVLCEKHDSDLIVVGARGRGLLKSMHIGSTAEWLMRCPGTPLVIARAALPVRRVVVCADGSGHARRAVDVLASMPWISGCEVDIVTIVEGEDEVGAAAHEAAEVLRAAGAHATIRVIEPDVMSITVNARYRILDLIDQLQPDLVVMGTKGVTGLPRLVVGSVAGAVVHAAPCSVLLARDPHEVVLDS